MSRSRQTFDKRFGKTLGKEFDYFYDELVKTLAANDSSVLGPGMSRAQRVRRGLKFCLLGMTLCLPVGAWSSSDGGAVPATLRQLAKGASVRQNWPALRAYARAEKNAEWRGWAYFLAGYSEYTAGSLAPADQDLGLAAQTAFSFADYAVFYQASAASQAGNHLEASEILQNFTTRFPRSHLHWQTFGLDAAALLQAQKPLDIIALLASHPEVRDHPTLNLLLAQAYQRVNRNVEAAHAFQEIYSTFPTAPESRPAGEALERLRQQLGENYPPPTDQERMGRAELLYYRGRYQDALEAFASLLKTEPASPSAPRWQMVQARCLLRLHRPADALELLFGHFPTPELEAQRLALLAQIHIQQSDADALTLDLGQLETEYSTSAAYAAALSAAGMFYYRQMKWQECARNYQRQADLFPHSATAREDGWRLAWCYYLLHDARAKEAIRDYLLAYPQAPRAPAALYWLARTEEQQGTEAPALYALLRKRFAHSYYAMQAAARLATLPVPATTNDLASGALATEIAAALGQPSIPAGLACLSSDSKPSARPAFILNALARFTLEARYLRAAIADGAASPDLRLLLARANAAQNDQAGALQDALRG